MSVIGISLGVCMLGVICCSFCCVFCLRFDLVSSTFFGMIIDSVLCIGVSVGIVAVFVFISIL